MAADDGVIAAPARDGPASQKGEGGIWPANEGTLLEACDRIGTRCGSPARHDEEAGVGDGEPIADEVRAIRALLVE